MPNAKTQGSNVRGLKSIIFDAKENGFIDDTPPQYISDFNREYALIKKPVSIMRLTPNDNGEKQFQLLNKTDFLMINANRYHKITADKGKKERIDEAPAWIKHRKRCEYEQIVFEPAQPSITKNNCYNIFQGFNVKPQKGDVSLYKELILHLCDYNERLAHEIICWRAHLLQYPWIKQKKGNILISRTKGAGKSTLGETTCALCAPYSTFLHGDDLAADFNNFMDAKIYIFIDEMDQNEKFQIASKLKTYITGKNTRVNEKFVLVFL